MPIQRHVYVSFPVDKWLSPAQNRIKWSIVERIEKLGYTTEIYSDPRLRSTKTHIKGRTFSPGEVEGLARRCCGAVIIGMPRWTFGTGKEEIKLASEFCHYEGALARSLGLPTLIFRSTEVEARGVFEETFSPFMADIPADAGPSWLRSDAFRKAFQDWKIQMSERRDVFLGYCSTSTSTAIKIKSFLKTQLGVTVLDWRTDFAPAQTILDLIQDAARRCSAGVFLFTQDDKLEGISTVKAVPRDNVVFESGYFTSLKHPQSVLIILEKGTKLPADLQSKVYANLKSRSSIASIERTLRIFVNEL